MTQFTYAGNELELFAHAANWKNYWSSRISPFVKGEIAEIGAGFGSNMQLLANSQVERYVAVEPDPELSAALREKCKRDFPALECEVINGTLGQVPRSRNFDCILYIDVLEHIEDDREQVAAAAGRLKTGGHLVVLSPAHQFLYTNFDKSIGHFRRYSLSGLLALRTDRLRPVVAQYLDSVGALASLGNKLFLKRDCPTLGNILTWDRCMVPLSRFSDPFCKRLFGRSVVVVWEKQ